MFDGVSCHSGRCGGRRRFVWAFGLLAAVLSWPAAGARAQEGPYFVTYGRTMEEPGNLEISLAPVLGEQRGGGNFLAAALELEYGLEAWWTTELYVDGQATAGDSAVVTGFRWEHRVRPLLLEHWLNPVLYVEFEDITEADKTLLEVVGHDVAGDQAVPNRIAQGVRQREMETKLILSSSLGDWDLSENLIAEKNLAGPPWEFGYAVGRPAAGARGAAGRLHPVPRELHRRDRDVRRSRRRPRRGSAGHVALPGAGAGVGPARRAGAPHLAGVRAECRQPPLPAALRDLLRALGLRAPAPPVGA